MFLIGGVEAPMRLSSQSDIALASNFG